MDLHDSLPDWLIEYPRLQSLVDALQLDYCCGGKSLETACRERALDPHAVLARFESAIDSRK